jgi:hypothetical protein
VLPPASRSYKERPDVGPRGGVSPAGLGPALPSASCWCLLPLGYEDEEPPPGVEPGHPLYESGPQPCAAAKLPLMASNHEPPGSEPGALPIELSGIK